MPFGISRIRLLLVADVVVVAVALSALAPAGVSGSSAHRSVAPSAGSGRQVEESGPRYCADQPKTRVTQQPAAAQLSAAGWFGGVPVPGKFSLGHYLSAASYWEVNQHGRQYHYLENRSDCAAQIAAQMGLTKGLNANMQPWQMPGSQLVTVYTYPGPEGQVAFAVVRDSMDAHVRYLLVFDGPVTPIGLMALMANYDGSASNFDGERFGTGGYLGLPYYGADVIALREP